MSAPVAQSGPLDYWRSRLSDLPPMHKLPLDRPRSMLAGAGTAEARFEHACCELERLEHAVTAPTLQQIGALAQLHATTAFAVLEAVFAVLVSRWSDETDVAIAVAAADCATTELPSDAAPGLLVLRTDLSGSPDFAAVLRQTGELVQAAFVHRAVSYDAVAAALAPAGKAPPRAPLCRIAFATRSLPPLPFDLRVQADTIGQGLRLSWNYDPALFDRVSVMRMADAFERLLQAAVANPQTPVAQLPLLGDADRALLAAWNATARDYPQACIQELFEAQAARAPEAIAIAFGNEQLSYAALNHEANRIAHYLIAHGLQPDGIVAVCAERSLDMVVGMLGILKAGGAYLPVDASYPSERLSYLFEDAGVRHVLADAEGRQALSAVGGLIEMPLEAAQRRAFLEAYPQTNIEHRARGATSRQLAYVIYTSGSTGRPKGVLVEHRSVVRLVVGNTYAPLGPEDCVAHCANPAFDAATWEVWGALLNGARLQVVPQADVLVPQRLERVLIDTGVTALWLTVGLFNQYVDDVARAFAGLRYLLIGGDALDPRTVARLLNGPHRPRHLLNGYGPTETTTFATTFEINEAPAATQSIPIGRPIANTQVHVLDAQGQQVPIGVVGELYIGGPGVARGYLHRPELSAARFMPDVFGEVGARLYKTGDLGRWLPDGTIEYRGRNDLQVKIRGFRVEPGEVEAALLQHAHVSEALVVVAGEGSDKHLVAYVLRATGQRDQSDGTMLAEELRTHLDARLPHYLRPAAYAVLERWPLTANGKIDRRALPVPARSSRQFTPPRTATEVDLMKIWSHLLKRDDLGLEADFFELGGHSLLATQLLARIDENFAVSLPLRALFEAPTLEHLAARVDSECTALPADDLDALLKSLEHLSDEEVSASLLAEAARSGGIR